MITSGRDSTASRSPTVSVRVLLAFAAIAYVTVFWRLGTPTFWDPDEAHYAETTRELLATGDWMAPTYNDQPFFDKPMLFHWLQAVPMGVLGPTEFAARLMPAIAALALVAVTGWAAAALLSTEAGLVAALLMATNPGIFALARYAILDSLFTLFLFGGAALITIAAVHRRDRLQWYGYVAIALAVLTKGPLALVLCGLAFVIAIVWSAEARRSLLRLRIVPGLVIVFAISAPWFVYMAIRFRDAFVNGYLLDENIRLYAADRFQPTASSSVWFYFRVLAAGLLPWTGLLVGRLYDDVRAALRRDGSLDQIDVLLWSWTIAIVGFFTFSKFKLDHYVFPAAPALALIGARAWVALRNNADDSRVRGSRIGLHLVGPLLIAVAVVAAGLLVARLNLPSTALLVPATLGAAGITTIVTIRRRKGQPPRAPWLVAGAMAVTYAGLVLWVMPALEERKVVPDVARWVAARAASTDHVATYRLNRWNTAFRFYVARHVDMIDGREEAAALFVGSEPFVCTMLGSAYDEFVAAGVPLRIVYEREGMWTTTGRVLWRTGVPLTRFVVVTRK